MTMDVCMKDIDESDWRFFKSESAKHGVKVGEFFNALIGEHKERCKNSNWKSILFGKKTLKGIVEREDFKPIRNEFRERFMMRGA